MRLGKDTKEQDMCLQEQSLEEDIMRLEIDDLKIGRKITMPPVQRLDVALSLLQ